MNRKDQIMEESKEKTDVGKKGTKDRRTVTRIKTRFKESKEKTDVTRDFYRIKFQSQAVNTQEN